MEVHHHHSKEHPKNWKEHFKEFFMLFLAVTLGFLAENLREIYVENERSHEYVASFMREVEKNSHFIDSLIDRDRYLLVLHDSAALYVMEAKEELDLFEFFDIVPTYTIRYVSNNDVYEQMRSAGALRYIKDTALLHMIIEYSNQSEATELRSTSQEMDFYYNGFVPVMNKWTLPGIAAYRHNDLIDRLTVKDQILGDNTSIFDNLSNIVNIDADYNIRSKRLELFKTEVIPVLFRRSNNIVSSMSFMLKTKKQAEELLQYYHDHGNH